MKFKFDGMLTATFLTTLFYSFTYPFIYKEIMMAASNDLIALAQIINCLSILFFGTVWNKWSEKLFRFYPAFCVLETAIGITTTAYAIITDNIVAYYILDTLVVAIVTRNICCGGVKLRAIRYTTDEAREHFDNNNNSMNAAATIIGSLLAMCIELDFGFMLCLATFGNAIDNAFYIAIFYRTRERRRH